MTFKQLRKSRGITLAELGKSVGKTAACVYNWQTGRTEPQLAQILTLTKIFGLSAEEIIGLFVKGGENDDH